VLRSSGLRQELPVELSRDSRRNRLDSSSEVVQDSLLGCGPFQETLSETEVAVQLIGQVLDRRKHVVLDRSVKLGDLVGGVHPCDAVLAGAKLELDVLTLLLRLGPTRLRLHDIRNPDDEVQLLIRDVVVDRVQQGQLVHESPQRGVGLVHHGVERVNDDGHNLLGKGDLLSRPPSLVVQLDSNVLRVPPDDSSYSHRTDVERSGLAGCRVDGRVDRYHTSVTIEQHREDNILHEGCSALVDVSLDGETLVETARDVLQVVLVLVNPRVHEPHTGDIDSNSVDDVLHDVLVGEHRRPAEATWAAESYRTGGYIRLVLCCLLGASERVPSMGKAVCKLHWTSFLFE